MVARKQVGLSDGERLVSALKTLGNKIDSPSTAPAGSRRLDDDDDIYWGGGSSTFSVRERAEALEEAKARLTVLTDVTLPELQNKLDAGLAELDGLDVKDLIEQMEQTQADLDGLGRVSTLALPPQDAVVGKTLWTAPNGDIYKAVPCEES